MQEVTEVEEIKVTSNISTSKNSSSWNESNIKFLSLFVLLFYHSTLHSANIDNKMPNNTTTSFITL